MFVPDGLRLPFPYHWLYYLYSPVCHLLLQATTVPLATRVIQDSLAVLAAREVPEPPVQQVIIDTIGRSSKPLHRYIVYPIIHPVMDTMERT